MAYSNRPTAGRELQVVDPQDRPGARHDVLLDEVAEGKVLYQQVEALFDLYEEKNREKRKSLPLDQGRGFSTSKALVSPKSNTQLRPLRFATRAPGTLEGFADRSRYAMLSSFEGPTEFSSPILIAEIACLKAVQKSAELRALRVASLTNTRTVIKPTLHDDRRLRLAVACLVFQRLVEMGSVPSVMEMVRVELMNAIFVSHSVDTASLWQQRDQGVAPPSEGSPMPFFFDLETYLERFEGADQKAKDRNSHHYAARMKQDIKLAALQSGVIASNHRILKRIIFNAWRSYLTNSPERRAAKLLGVVLQSSDYNLRRTYFDKFRRWIGGRKAEQALEVEEETKSLLNQDDPFRSQTLTEMFKDSSHSSLVVETKKGFAADIVLVTRMSDKAKLQARMTKDELIDYLRMELEAKNHHIARLQETGDAEMVMPIPNESVSNTTAQPTSPVRRASVMDWKAKMQSALVHESGRNPLALVEGIAIPEMLKTWCNLVLERSRYHATLHVSDLELSFLDGKVFIAIIAILFPEYAADYLMQVDSAPKRIERLLQNFYNLELFDQTLVTVTDICNGSVGSHLFLIWIWTRWHDNHRRDLIDVDSGHADDLPMEDVISLQVLYEFSDRMELARHLREGMNILSRRLNQWIQNVMMSKIREAHLDSSTATDVIEFTAVDPAYVGDVVEKVFDAKAECSRVSQVLKLHYHDLKKIYDFYRSATEAALNRGGGIVAPNLGSSAPNSLSASPRNAVRGASTAVRGKSPTTNPAGPTFDASSGPVLLAAREFFKLMSDCKADTRPGVTKSSIEQAVSDTRRRALDDEIARVVAAGRVIDAKSLFEAPLAHFSLSKKLFVEVLVRICVAIVQSQGKPLERNLSQALSSLIVDSILPKAMSSSRLEFKRLVSHPQVQDLVTSPQTAKFLSKVYRYYCSGTTMLKGDFMHMLLDLQLVDKSMNKAEVMSIFSEVQDDDLNGPDETGEVMSFGEFCDALCAIAMFKFPHPMQSLSHKLQRFLNNTFIPTCKSHLGKKL